MKYILFIFILLFSISSVSASWDNEYREYQKEITISHINVSGSNLLNYPAFINVSKEDNMQSDYDDLIFYDTSGNQMAAELEKGYTDYALLWINITTLETTDTSFWMYYGNDTCSSSWNAGAVWNPDYKIVQHLQESPANGSAGHLDSTNNNNDGTPQGFNSSPSSTTDATGRIDGGDIFDGADDYINCGDGANLNIVSNITIAAWVKTTVAGTSIVQKYNSDSPYNGYGLNTVTSTGKLRGYTDGMTWQLSTDSVTDGEWHHVAMTGAGSSGAFYIDGSPSGTFTYVFPSNNINEILYIGSVDATGGWFNGYIDEVRISNAGCALDWIKQDYEMVVNQSTIVTFGNEYKHTHPFLTGAYLFFGELESGLTDFKDGMGKYLIWGVIFFAVGLAFALIARIKQTIIGGK